MKKVISLTVAFVMLLALTISAFAADNLVETQYPSSQYHRSNYHDY